MNPQLLLLPQIKARTKARRCSSLASLLLVLLTLPIQSCMAPEKSAQPSSDSQGLTRTAVGPLLLESTIVPSTAFEAHPKSASPMLPSQILIPRPMLDRAKISVKKASLRSGPGTQFALIDQLLQRGDLVVKVQSSGVWNYVISEGSPISGWVHAKSLEDPPSTAGSAPIPVYSTKLPTVFSKNAIQSVYEFPTKKPLNAKIPKGTHFPLLKAGKEYALVWIPSNHSVMWLKRVDLDLSNP